MGDELVAAASAAATAATAAGPAPGPGLPKAERRRRLLYMLPDRRSFGVVVADYHRRRGAAKFKVPQFAVSAVRLPSTVSVAMEVVVRWGGGGQSRWWSGGGGQLDLYMVFR